MEPRNLILACLALIALSGLSTALTNITSCSVLGTAGETYVLQNDIAGSMGNGVCIHITADRVTLLCGGHIIGSDDSKSDIIGIRVEGGRATIRGCEVGGYTYDGGIGYGLLAYGYDNLTLEDSSFGKNEIGAHIYSNNAIIRRCNSTMSSSWGFYAQNSGNARVSDCISSGNGHGFWCSNCDYAVFERNIADGNNPGSGFMFQESSHMRVSDNNASENRGDGFYLGAEAPKSHNNLTRNLAMGNWGNGFILLSDHNLISGNTAGGNSGNGFVAAVPSGCSECTGEYNEFIGNTAYGNGDGEAGASGFLINAANTALTDNLAYENYMYGFRTDSSIFSHVTGVTLSENVAYGHHNCGRACSGTGFMFSGTTVLVSSPFDAGMSGNIAYDNDYGLMMHNGGLTMDGDRFFDNGVDLDASNPSDFVTSTLGMSSVIFDRDEGDVIHYTALSLEDLLFYDSKTGAGEHYMIGHAEQPEGDMPFGVPFHHKFLDITDACDPEGECPQADIDHAVWHWSGPEERGYSNIQLWELGDKGWSLMNDTPLSRTLGLEGIGSFSVFALLANYTPVDGDDGGSGGDGGASEGGQNETPPSCTDDDGCAVNEICTGGVCERIECACGAFVGHSCVRYACCSDSDCGAGGKCMGNSCIMPKGSYECVSDLQCPAQEYCNVPAGGAGGECEPVPPKPCGEVKNHMFVPYGYECGPEKGCPSCPEGLSCLNHECVGFGISCPTSAFVGSDVTCTASREGAPCAGCAYKFVAPDGSGGTGFVDGDGKFTFRMDRNGTYRVSLFENGNDVKSIQVKALPKAEPEKPEGGQSVPDGALLLWALLVLAAIAIALAYWRRGKSGGKPKK